MLRQFTSGFLATAAFLSLTSAVNAQLKPSDFETPEYYRNWGLQYTFASEAYALGFTGKGVRIGIADTAMQWGHPELIQRVYWPAPLYEFPTPGYPDFPDHGTHVAGIAAAERDGIQMMGVAYDSSIAAVTVVPWNDGYPADKDWAQSLIDANVSVVNASIGPDANPKGGPQVYFQVITKKEFHEYIHAVTKLANADVVMVWASGNEFDDQPNASMEPSGAALLPLITPANTSEGYPFADPIAPTSALYRIFNNDVDGQDVNTWLGNQIPESSAITYDFSDLKGTLIAVGSVEFDGGKWGISGFSNRCGLTADWCVVAPGVEINSSVPMNTYAKESGTSMSAPFVAGSAALVRQAFPYMTARQVIEVILTTATPIPYLDADKIGHGLVNVGRAVRGPIEFGHPSLLPGNESIFEPIFAVDTQGYNSVWSNDISGIGGFSKAGEGILKLTGNNIYTGDTNVLGGLLVVDGSIANSNLTVVSGGTIGGSGQLGSITLASGAVHAPGNSIGEMTIAGNYNMNIGSYLKKEVKGPQNDKLSINGNANIDGEVVILPFGGGSPYPYFDYQLIDSTSNIAYTGSINQDAVTSTLLSYGADLIVGNDGDATTFDLSWQPKNGTGVIGSSLKGLGINNVNQRSTANVLDTSLKKLASVAGNDSSTTGKNSTGSSIANTGFTTGQADAAGYKNEFVELLDNLVQLSSATELSSAINSLSPEPYAAFQSVGLIALEQQRQLIATHAGRCDSTGWVPTINDTNVEKTSTIRKNSSFCIFGDGGASNTSISGSNGLSSYQSNTNVAFWGLEYTPSKQWSIGTAYGYGNANLYGLKSSYANVSSTNNMGSIYGVYRPIDQLELLANFGYTKFNINASRSVSFVGNGKVNTANTSADGFSTSFDAKYSIPVNMGSVNDWLIVSPMLGIAWGNYQQSGFTESGGGATALQVDSHTANSLIGTIGFELSTTPISLGKNDSSSSFTPKLEFTYNVDALANSSSTKEIKSSFVAAPGAGSMLTQGQNGGANSFTIAAGGDLKMSESTALYASVDYQIEDNGSQLGYSGGLRFLF